MKQEHIDKIKSCYDKTGEFKLNERYFAEKTGIENLLLERTEKPQETSEDYKEG